MSRRPYPYEIRPCPMQPPRSCLPREGRFRESEPASALRCPHRSVCESVQGVFVLGRVPQVVDLLLFAHDDVLEQVFERFAARLLTGVRYDAM